VPDEDLRNPISRVSEEDYQDYDFILSDLQRNLELSPEEQLERFRADPWGAFSGLKAANGFDLPLSREAQKRFTNIANRGLKSLGTSARVHRLEKVVEALRGELSSMLQAGLVPGEEDTHEVFRSALRRLEAAYAELTYYVPCSVVAERTYPKFTIGPVTFLLRDEFFKQNESAIQKSAEEYKNPRATEVLLAQTYAFYSDFQWIASITVSRCDSEVSRRRAHAGIQKALDVFKLLVGSRRASQVKQAYDFTAPSKYVELVSSPAGSFSFRSGTKTQDALLNDHWYDQVTGGPAWPFLQSVLVNYCDAWEDLDEIQTRFLDALSWHSDAISEEDPGAKILKFWTSIERILRASPGDIDTRAAILSSNTVEEFARHSQRLEQAYRRGRNDVVHGNANRASESWYAEAVAASEEASMNVLFQYLYAIPQIRAHQGATDRKKLREWLKRLDDLAERYLRQLRVK
jgi:hypothetical protein